MTAACLLENVSTHFRASKLGRIPLVLIGPRFRPSTFRHQKLQGIQRLSKRDVFVGVGLSLIPQARGDGLLGSVDPQRYVIDRSHKCFEDEFLPQVGQFGHG